MLKGPHSNENGTSLDNGRGRYGVKNGYTTGFIFVGGMAIIFISILIKRKFFEAFYRFHILITIFIIIMCLVHPA